METSFTTHVAIVSPPVILLQGVVESLEYFQRKKSFFSRSASSNLLSQLIACINDR